MELAGASETIKLICKSSINCHSESTTIRKGTRYGETNNYILLVLNHDLKRALLFNAKREQRN